MSSKTLQIKFLKERERERERENQPNNSTIKMPHRSERSASGSHKTPGGSVENIEHESTERIP